MTTDDYDKFLFSAGKSSSCMHLVLIKVSTQWLLHLGFVMGMADPRGYLALVDGESFVLLCSTDSCRISWSFLICAQLVQRWSFYPGPQRLDLCVPHSVLKSGLVQSFFIFGKDWTATGPHSRKNGPNWTGPCQTDHSQSQTVLWSVAVSFPANWLPTGPYLLVLVSYFHLHYHWTCSLHEHETELCKTIQLMGTEMEFANCWDDVHVIRDLEGWTCFYPPAKLHIPLASHIINNESFSDSCGVIRKCSTDWVINIFLPKFQYISVVVFWYIKNFDVLLPFIKIHYTMWHKTTMPCAGSGPYASGLEIRPIHICLIYSAVVVMDRFSFSFSYLICD